MNPIQRRRTVRPQFALHPLGLAALLAVGGTAWALPQGGTVVSGQIKIGAPSAGVQVITQGTQKGVIDWRSFSIASGEKVVFNQVSSSAVTLNRVIGYDPSRILGQMSANGQVFLINPQGIVFGSGARIDVGGMVASSLSLSNADFQAGRYDLRSAAGAQLGAVRNEGTIVAHGGGTVALVAPQVSNQGTIEAQGGRVGLAAVDAVSVDVEGDGLIFFQASGASTANRLDQLGRIRADGGTVEMRAAARATMADTVLNMDGIVQARGLRGDGGTVVIDGGAAGATLVRGTVDVSAADAGATGGTAKVLGHAVGLVGSATIDASGNAGGGTVLIGGNFQGKGPEANAFRTFVGGDATIRADAGAVGNGGRIIVWADDVTRFYGTISARGGLSGGNGGFAEVSGKGTLVFDGHVDLGAPLGERGDLLLDPQDITIAGGGDNNANPPEFDGNQILFAEGDADENVTVGANRLNTANADITLQATRDIILDTNISLTNAGRSLTLQAGDDIRSSNATARNITTNGGNVTLTANDPLSGNASGTGGISGIDTITTTRDGAAASGIVTLRVAGGTDGITVGSIVTSGGTAANGATGVAGGSVSIRSNSGAINVGAITTDGGAGNTDSGGGGAGRNGGAAGSITVAVDNPIAGSTITLGNLSAKGGNGSDGSAGTGGGAGGVGGAVTITTPANGGSGTTSGVLTLGSIVTTGGNGGNANNDAAVNEAAGAGGNGGGIDVSVLGGVTFSGGSGSINSRGGTGGNGDAGDTLAGNGGAGASISITAATATTGPARTLTLPNGWQFTSGGGNAGTGQGTGTPTVGASGNVSLTGRGVTLGDGASGTVIDAGTGTISIDGNGGAISFVGDIITDNTTANAVVIRDASTVALGDITTAVGAGAENATVTLGVGGDITGAVTQTGTIVTTVLAGSTTGSVSLGTNDNQIANLGAFASGNGFSLKDSAGTLDVDGTVTSTGAISITTPGALSLNSSDITGVGVTLNSVGITSAGGTVDGGSGTVLIDANDGSIVLAGGISTTNTGATSVRIINATSAALGDITSAGTVVIGEAAGNNISGAISQSGSTTITAGTVTAVGGSTITLGNDNSITNLGAISRGGALTVKDTVGGLNVTGAITGGTTSNAVSITATAGELSLQSNITTTTGAGTLTLSGVGVSQTTGTLLVSATTSVTGGTGTISLGSATNDFTGAVTLDATGASVSVTDTNNLTLAAPTLGANTGITAVAGSTLTLPAVAISTGAGNIEFRSNGGNLSTAGTLSTTSGTISLSASGNLILSHTLTSTTAGGDITLTGTSGLDVGADVDGKGDVTLTTDLLLGLTGDIGNATTGRVTLQPVTASQTISFLSPTVADLSISTVELARLTDGGLNTGVLQIGRTSSTGQLTIGDPLALGTPLSIGGGGLVFEGVAATRPVALNQSITLTSTGTADLIIRGPVTLSQATTTLKTAPGTGNITIDGSVSGAGKVLEFDATGSTGSEGKVTVTGAVGALGSELGEVTITNSNGAEFEQALFASTVTVTDTTSGATVAFRGDVDGSATTFDLAAKPYNLLFGGSTNTFAGAFTFANQGSVQLGDASTDTFSFNSGFVATAPSLVRIVGQVTLGGGNVTLSNVTSEADALLDAGTGTIRIDGNGGAIDLGAGTFRSSAAGVESIVVVNATTVELASLEALGAGATVRIGADPQAPLAGDRISGNIGQNADTGITAAFLTGSGGGQVLLDQSNQIGTLNSFQAANGLTIVNAGALTVAATAVVDADTDFATTPGGVLRLEAAGDLTITGATLSGTGIQLETTGPSRNITSSSGTMNARSGDVDITATGDVSVLSDINNAGTLTGSSGGVFTLTGANTIAALGAITSSGAVSILDSSGGLAVNGTVSGLGVTLDAGSGTLTLNADVNGGAGTVRLDAGSSVLQNSGLVTAGTLTGSANASVTLNNVAIDTLAGFTGGAGSLSITDTTAGLSVTGTVAADGATSLSTDGGTLALNTSSVSAGTTLTLSGGAVTGTGPIVAQTLAVTGSTGAVSLTGTGNIIDNLAASSAAGAFTLNDSSGPLAVTGTVTAGTGALTLSSAGALSLGTHDVSGVGVSLTGLGVSNSASSTIDAGSGTVAVNGLGGAIALAGDITTTNASGSAVVISNGTTASLGNITTGAAGTTTIGVTGAITQVLGSVISTGTLSGSTSGSATFGNANLLTNLGGFTANGLTVNDAAGGLDVTGAVSAGAGALSLTTATGDLALGASSVTAGTTMVLTGVGVSGTGVVTAGTLTVNGGSGEVSLTNVSNAIGTLGASSGNGFTLADAGGLTVSGDVSAGSGALALSTTGGALALGTSDLTAGTSMALSAGSGVSGTGLIQASSLTVTGGTGAVSLTNTANAIDTLGASSGVGFALNNSGDLAVTGTVNAGAGQLSIVTSGALNLGTSNLSATGTGHVLQGVGITQAGGSVDLDGATSVNAGAGAIDLDSTANDFSGSVTLSSAAAVSVADANNLTVGSLTSGTNSNVTLIAGAGGGTGSLSLALTGGALNIGTGVLSLTANNGSLSLNGTVNAGQLVIAANAISLGGSITTSVAGQTYNGGITLVSNLTLRTLANDSDIVIGGGGVTGGGSSLTLRTNTDPSSVVRISGGVGGVSALTVTGEAEISGAVTTSGDQTYNNGITLFGNSTLEAGGALQVTGDIAGAGFGLGLTGASIIVDGVTAGVSTLDVTGDIRVGGDVVTSGAQTYGGEVTLNADVEFEGTSLSFDNGLAAGSFDVVLRTNTLSMDSGVLSGSGGAITYATLNPNLAIDVARAGSGLVISKAMFETNGFSSITVGEAGTTAGAIGFGSVVLSASTTVNTTSTVTFAGTVDSRTGESNGLNVVATGTTTFSGAVGGTTPLASLTVDRNAVISGGVVNTSGTQDWGGNVTLGGDTTMTGSSIGFGTDGGTGQLDTGNHDLTVHANTITVDTVADSTGLTTLAPFAVGGSIGLAGGAGTLSLSQALLNKFAGTETLQIGRSGGTGAITANNLTLPTDVRIVSSSGSVTFSGTINGRTDATALGGQSLTVTTTGLTTFGGAVGGTNRLFELTTEGNNEPAPGSSLVDTRIEADIRTTGAQTYNDDVLLVGTRTLTGSAVNFLGGIGGDGIVLRPANADDTIGIGVAAGEAGFDFRVTQAQLDQLRNFEEVIVGGDDGTGDITIRALTLQSSLTVLGDTAKVNIVGALDALAGRSVSLLVDTGGRTTVGADIGQVVPLAGLTINGEATLNTAAVTTAGTQVWGGPLAVNSETTLQAGRVEFGGTVTVGGSALHVFSNEIVAAAAVSGNAVQLASGTVDGSIGIAGASGDLEISQTLLDLFAGVDQLTIGHGNGAGAIRSDAVTLSTHTLLQSDRGNVTLSGSVDSDGGVFDLTVVTGGITTIGGDFGLTGALGTLTIQGATRLSGASRIAAGAVDFGGTVDGARALTVTADSATFRGDVGGTTALTSLTLASGGGTASLAGDVTTTGAQSYAGALVLDGDATLSGSTLSFARSIDSAAGSTRALVLNAATRAQLDGPVGGTDALSSLTVNGETRLNASEVSTTGAQVYNGVVTLGSGAGVLLDAGSVRFASTVDGAANLTVDSAGLTRFDGDIGATTELASLRLQGGGSARIGGDTVRSSGAQSWGGAVALSGSTTFRAGSLNFGGAVSGADDLTLVTNTLTGATSLSGTGTLSISTREGGRTIELAPTAANAGRLQIGQAVLTGARAFDRHVIGSASGSGDIVANALDLAADTVLRTATGDITLSGRVDGAFALALNSGGTTTISGPVGTRTALASLTTDNNAAAADWDGTSGERTVFDKADASGSARVFTTGAQTYNDPVVSSVPVLFRGGAITATQVANAFGDAVNVDADTLQLASGESITLGNLTVTNDSSVVAGGVLTLKGDIDLQGGTLRLVSNATPGVLPEFSDPEHVGKSFGLTGLGEATATITQTGGSVRTASGTLLVLRAAGNGSISLEGTGNAIAGEISAVAGASGVAPGEPAADQALSFVRIASSDIRVAGSPSAGSADDRLGIEGDVVKLTADRLATGADGTIRARLPFRPFFGSNTQIPALTLVLSQQALTVGNQFGSGNDPVGWIRVSLGDSQGAFLTVRPKGAGSDTAFVLLSGDPAIQPFYDGAGKVTEVRVFYNGDTARTAQETGALAAVQAVAEDARQTRFEEAVRTENVRMRLRSGVIAEVGAGRPATVGRESIKLPDNCEPKGKTLECQ